MLKKIPLLLLLLLAAGWFVFLRPVELGGPAAYVVVSGDSMLPTLEPGDLVVTRAEDSYDEGDVAVYGIPDGQPGSESGARIIHRLYERNPDGTWQALGDNREKVDPWTPTDGDVVGAEWVVFPGGGDLLIRALQPAVVAALAGGLAAFFVVTSSGRRREQEPAE